MVNNIELAEPATSRLAPIAGAGRSALLPWAIVALALAASAATAQSVPNVSPNPVAPPGAPSGSVAPEPANGTIYARAVRSVVLILCRQKEGGGTSSGAGSVITSDGLILTNVHVIAGSTGCFAVFKPPGYQSVGKDTPMYALRAVAADPARDLALMALTAAPRGLTPLPLGRMAEVDIGQEVHAIGHPVGNFWTYTKGVVSQIRLKERGIEPFVADVVQTQTPISPGNSGGPLLSGAGRIVGVNTYVRKDAQNVNFAVAPSEIEAFLAGAARGEHAMDGTPPAPGGESRRAETPPARGRAEKCEPRVLAEAPSRRIPGKTLTLDVGCTGQANAAMLIPDDPARERILYVSTRKSESGAERYYDKRYYIDARTGKILRSWHDVDGDGKPDYMGVHRDGEAEASEFLTFSGSIGLRD